MKKHFFNKVRRGFARGATVVALLLGSISAFAAAPVGVAVTNHTVDANSGVMYIDVSIYATNYCVAAQATNIANNFMSLLAQPCRVLYTTVTKRPTFASTNMPLFDTKLYDTASATNSRDRSYVTITQTNAGAALPFGGGTSGSNSAGVTYSASLLFTNGYLIPGRGTVLTTNTGRTAFPIVWDAQTATTIGFTNTVGFTNTFICDSGLGILLTNLSGANSGFLMTNEPLTMRIAVDFNTFIP